jgi:hypothetical protein
MEQTRKLADIRKYLLKEFQKSKLDLWCSKELKEIKNLVNESVWDFDKRFKILMDQLKFQILDEQHREWFIVVLLLHVRCPLT